MLRDATHTPYYATPRTCARHAPPRHGTHTHLRAHRATSDEATLDESLGVVTHDLTIFARAGLALIGVDHEISAVW
jgi:hypothetical protein